MSNDRHRLPGTGLNGHRARQVLAHVVRYRLVDAIGKLGLLDDARIFYIVADNDTPAEGTLNSGAHTSTLVHLASLNDLTTARGRRATIQGRGISIVSVIAASAINAHTHFAGARFAHRLVRMPLRMGGRLPLDSSPDNANAAARYHVSTLALLLLWLHAIYRRLICGVTGHTTILHFEPRRLALRCTDCGHETPGWIIGGSPTSRAVPELPSTTRASSDRAA